jgi:hypothetical protein
VNFMTEPTPKQPRSPLRPVLAALAVLIPLVPVVIALTLSSGGSAATVGTTTATTSHFSPVAVTPKPAVPNRLLPPGRGALVALVLHPTVMRATPGGRVFAKVSIHTGFGSPQAMWVRQLDGKWLGVVSPQAGNNHLGWIPVTDVSLARIGWQLHVSLAKRQVTVVDDGRAVQHYTIAVGAPGSPTPTGHFDVTDRLNTGDPSGPYGCCILALSAVAPHAIQDWSGGNRIAIHSTPETSSIGHDVSHGCMRLTLAEGRWLLGHIPTGTPVVITT